jgi:hypothetical protein
MYLELIAQVRNRPARMPKNILSITTSPADDQIEKYEFYLNEIMRNVREARAYSPCSGCKKTVESIKITTLGSLVALAVFKAMTSEGKSRADFSDDEIARIKKDVERRYANY